MHEPISEACQENNISLKAFEYLKKLSPKIFYTCNIMKNRSLGKK